MKGVGLEEAGRKGEWEEERGKRKKGEWMETEVMRGRDKWKIGKGEKDARR